MKSGRLRASQAAVLLSIETKGDMRREDDRQRNVRPGRILVDASDTRSETLNTDSRAPSSQRQRDGRSQNAGQRDSQSQHSRQRDTQRQSLRQRDAQRQGSRRQGSQRQSSRQQDSQGKRSRQSDTLRQGSRQSSRERNAQRQGSRQRRLTLLQDTTEEVYLTAATAANGGTTTTMPRMSISIFRLIISLLCSLLAARTSV